MAEREEIIESLRESERQIGQTARLIWERYKPTTMTNIQRVITIKRLLFLIATLIVIIVLRPAEEAKFDAPVSIFLGMIMLMYFFILDPEFPRRRRFPFGLDVPEGTGSAVREELPKNNMEKNIKDLQDAYSSFRKTDVNSGNCVDEPKSETATHQNKDELYHQILKSFQHEVDKDLKKSCLLDEVLCWAYSPLSEEIQKLYNIDRESLNFMRELHIMLEGKMKENKVSHRKTDIINDLITNLEDHKNKYTEEMEKRKKNPNPAMEVRGLRPIMTEEGVVFPRNTNTKSSNIQEQTNVPTTKTTQKQTRATSTTGHGSNPEQLQQQLHRSKPEQLQQLHRSKAEQLQQIHRSKTEELQQLHKSKTATLTNTTQKQTGETSATKTIEDLIQIAECYLLNNDEIFPKSIDELALYVYVHNYTDTEKYGVGREGWIQGLKIAAVKHMLQCTATILDEEYDYWNTYVTFKKLLKKRNPEGTIPYRLRYLQ